MRTCLALVAAAALAAVSARAENLRRLGLDDASAATPKIEADTAVKVEGTGSLRITARWPTTVCLGEATGPGVEGAQLVYSARVRTELDGTAYLEMWVHAGGGEFFSRGLNDVVSQKTDGKTIRTPFLFRTGQRPDKVTLNLVINGAGTVRVGDVVLSREPPG